MNKPIYLLIFLILTACYPAVDDEVIDDFEAISEALWTIKGYADPYPFTVKFGNIACTMNEVYFFPNDTVNDASQMALPLNKLAQMKLKTENIQPTVKNTIKTDANLSEAIRIGLNICRKSNEQFNNR